MGEEGVRQYFILPSDTKRTRGQEAQRMNIQAARLVADMVRTTLGPKGMDKMIVDAAGGITVTNDGVTILREMNIDHPTARMVVEIARTQEHEVGDGTTTAVVLAGELLRQAEALLDQEIHPTVIAKGYRLATEHALKELTKLAKEVQQDREVLTNVAMTATTGKGAEAARAHLAGLVIRALTAVAHNGVVDPAALRIERKTGASVEESSLIDGILLDKERCHAMMPRLVRKAKVLLLESALEIRNTETDAKISISDPEKLQSFLDMEEQMVKRMTDLIIASGASAVFCQRGIDDMAQHFLAKAGILGVRRVKRSDMERLAMATGGQMVSGLEDLDTSVLGTAGLIEEVRVGDEPMVAVRECLQPKALTILVRGGTEHVVAEVQRALEDAAGVVRVTLETGKVLAGAGAPELELARGLRTFARSMRGREQLAVEAFAQALEVIPRTLAENAGLDPIDAMADLKAAHEAGEIWAGINVFTGKRMDAWKEGVLEPLKVKTQAITSAVEVATLILRIDDVINAETKKQPSSAPSFEE